MRKKYFQPRPPKSATSRGPIWSGAFGRLTFEPDSPAASTDTIFDLASLTKPLATATLAMDLMRLHALDLRAPVSTFFAEWRGTDRESVTVRDLLEHASGLPARLVDPPPATRREFEHDICGIRLEYEPRSRSVYSDLGFLLLGFLVEARGGSDLSRQFGALWAPFARDGGANRVARLRNSRRRRIQNRADDPARQRSAAGACPRRRSARQLRGRARRRCRPRRPLWHGGGRRPFCARDVAGARAATQRMAGPFSPDVVARVTTKTTVPGSSRALGWDTMLPTSSCGTRLSAAAFGHVGFTGTSLWIDPILDRYFVLLTNRVFGSGGTAGRDARRPPRVSRHARDDRRLTACAGRLICRAVGL